MRRTGKRKEIHPWKRGARVSLAVSILLVLNSVLRRQEVRNER